MRSLERALRSAAGPRRTKLSRGVQRRRDCGSSRLAAGRAPVSLARSVPGIYLKHGDTFVAMTETPYTGEGVLQALVAEHPEMLASDDAGHGPLLLVKREAPVSDQEDGGGRWWLDHLYLDAQGVPTLVEVKRGSDTRGRREVVAQMLDYAANAKTSFNTDQLQVWLAEDAARRGSTVEETLRETLGIEDGETYWETVRTNLAAERLRLIFVSDVIGTELRKIIEFLNGQMTRTDVLAIEVKQYVDETGAQQTIVPRVVGDTQAAREVKGRSGTKQTYDRESFLEAVRVRDAAAATAASRLLDWADRRPDLHVWFGSSASAMIGPIGTTNGLLGMYGYAKIDVRFKTLAHRPPFDDPDRLEELVEQFNAIDGVRFPPGKRDWPSTPLAPLADERQLEQFIAVVETALDVIASS